MDYDKLLGENGLTDKGQVFLELQLRQVHPQHHREVWRQDR